MPFTSRRVSTSALAVVAILTGVGLAWIGTRTAAQPAVMIDADDIGGVVRSASGPEAGVWVIAETDDLATKYRQDRGHGRSGTVPSCRTSPTLATACGFADTASSIRVRSRANRGKRST